MPEPQVDTAGAVAALAAGRTVYSVSLLGRHKVLGFKVGGELLGKPVAAIERRDKGYEVRFVDGTRSVVTGGATFWVAP
jgi:hypothetical protein